MIRLLSLILFFPFPLFAYNSSVLGTVVDGKTNKPIAGATVFINHSLHYTLTDSSGNFQLNDIDNNRFEIVAAANNYDLSVYRASNLTNNLSIRFQMDSLPITGTNENLPGKLYEETFLKGFLGLSENAYQTYIVNTQVIQYNLNNGTGILTVFANQPLQIMNEGLGYLVNCYLESFAVNIATGMAKWQGYYYFKHSSTSNPLLQQKWNEQRQVAYYGSLQHFIRSLMADQIESEGFTIKMVKRFYEDDASYKTVLKNKSNILLQGELSVNGRDKKFSDIIQEDEIKAPQVKTTDSTGAVVLYTFPESLLVSFDAHNVPLAIKAKLISTTNNRPMVSMLTMGKQGVTIENNGEYFNAPDLFIQGFMTEKMAELLPSSYHF